jgi:hypothetical protein
MCKVDSSHVNGEYSPRRANQVRQLAEATIYGFIDCKALDDRIAGIDSLAILASKAVISP